MDEDHKNQNGIIIVGGYGHVGRQIAERLIEDERFFARIAGRNEAKANAAAKELGCTSVALDLRDPHTWDAALGEMKAAIVCVDQTDTQFVEYLLAKGLHYLDITADDAFFRKVEQLTPIAETSGGKAVLSVGLAPGLTNLMVKACADKLDQPLNARIGILLGLGDTHGPAAIDWTLRNFRPAKIDGMPFGNDKKPHPALPFDFADQHVLRRTLGISDIHTLLTFDSRILSRMLFRLLPLITKHPALRRLVSKSMMYIRLGSDRAAVSVEVTGLRNKALVRQSMLLEGRQEAAITALVAAKTVPLLFEATVPAGVWHIDQVASIDQYRHALEAEGVSLSRSENVRKDFGSPPSGQ